MGNSTFKGEIYPDIQLVLMEKKTVWETGQWMFEQKQIENRKFMDI